MTTLNEYISKLEREIDQAEKQEDEITETWERSYFSKTRYTDIYESTTNNNFYWAKAHNRKG